MFMNNTVIKMGNLTLLKYIHDKSNTHTHMYIHTYKCTHIHIYTHTHIYT